MKVKVTVNTKNAEWYINKKYKNAQDAAHRGNIALAENIKMLAKQLAPRYPGSGKTANLIVAYHNRGPDGTVSQVVSKNSSGRASFNLPSWMHDTGGVHKNHRVVRFRDGQFRMIPGTPKRPHIKSGDPQYMYTAREQVRRDKKRIFENEFKI
jgi:hypothetical protein